jgi:hypothetical protein
MSSIGRESGKWEGSDEAALTRWGDNHDRGPLARNPGTWPSKVTHASNSPGETELANACSARYGMFQQLSILCVPAEIAEASMENVFASDLGGMDVFSAVTYVVAAGISGTGSTDSGAMLGAAAAALEPTYPAAHVPAQTNNLAAKRLVTRALAAIDGASASSKAAIDACRLSQRTRFWRTTCMRYW